MELTEPYLKSRSAAALHERGKRRGVGNGAQRSRENDRSGLSGNIIAQEKRTFNRKFALLRAFFAIQVGGGTLLPRSAVDPKRGAQNMKKQIRIAARTAALTARGRLTAGDRRAIIRKDGWSTERNFVNVMREGSDYLVFLRDYDKIRWDDCTVYYLDENRVIAPVFCYDDIPNIVIPKSGSDTYVPYSEVRDNEFFAASQAGLDAWLSLKQEMLAAYPRQ